MTGTVALIFAALAFLVIYRLRRKREEFQARIAEDRPTTYTVILNDVQVGTLRDAEYARMQLAAMDDLRVFVAQVLNVARVVLNMAGKLLVAVPFIVFWLFAGAALFSPESFTDSVASLKNADPQALLGAVRTMLSLAFTVSFTVSTLTAGLMLLMGQSFGFKNLYAAAIHSRLRRHCNMPAEGEIVLVGVATGPAPGQLGRVTN
ncbi:hypothetical protein I5U70_32775 (plasmid) [Pseudomonas aeruginosa]|uniref:hypothetical protein n=1 Tax=Pseudomonas aeruginosa TaxID=287 RepID=UPI0018CA1D79|nr:hypothetical protein [Pseudomonas aeruginosa]QPN17990.1 hypothetical protein I5U70_32775 [Pseudomonas aeruginosa]